MEPIPLPSHIHYELLLQLLEQQTLVAARNKTQHAKVHELVVTLRKALTQQKQLEEFWQRENIPVDYRWSLNVVSRSETNP